MFRRGLGFCVVLVVASCAYGNIEIDLRPAHPGLYAPGEVVNVEVWFVDVDFGHPITAEDILFRGYQLDFTRTDATLGLPDAMEMETDDLEVNLIYPDLPRPMLIWPGTAWHPLLQMSLPAEGEMLVGNLDVTVNDTGWVDVMNPEDDINLGAWTHFGFGVTDEDPEVVWRSYTGELTRGQLLIGFPSRRAWCSWPSAGWWCCVAVERRRYLRAFLRPARRKFCYTIAPRQRAGFQV